MLCRLLISICKSRVNRLMELCRAGTTLTHWLFTQKLFCCAKEHQEDHLLIHFPPARHLQSIKHREQKREQKGWNECSVTRQKLHRLHAGKKHFYLARQGTFPCIWATRQNKSSFSRLSHRKGQELAPASLLGFNLNGLTS